MLRIAAIALGWVFFVLGLIGMLTPIPFGIVCLMLSMLLLIPSSPRTVGFIRRMRQRSSYVDRVMAAVIRRAPAPYRRILRRTDIDNLMY